MTTTKRVMPYTVQTVRSGSRLLSSDGVGQPEGTGRVLGEYATFGEAHAAATRMMRVSPCGDPVAIYRDGAWVCGG